ncbi:transcriptional elongation factor [Cardiosporidium cionae]|uniref:FACT complex subunit n=1 Tax=Cardiosporidium cionae TaxID=476202 RepID=A0ABQ7J4S3_9APIC|nr:transcriptional elongation factor [Cardiosporidium cionae]|eukprot:KAF8818763.1 transcriptional elongation factor [Cardiosporidium cionae]
MKTYARSASTVACAVLKQKLIFHIENVLDNEKKETHADISALADAIQTDAKLCQKLKDKYTIDCEEVDLVYANVQSNGEFELRTSVQPTTTLLSQTEGSIIVSLGMKYKEYCANIVRTLLLNGQKEQKDVYLLALNVMKTIFQSLKHGKHCNEIYEAARQYILDTKPELINNFVKSVGHAIGVEFRDTQFVLNGKNSTGILENGMTLNISVGFYGLKTKSDLPFAVWIAETVHMPLQGGEPSVLTDFVSKRLEHVSYELNDEEEEKQKKMESTVSKSTSSSGGISAAILNNADSVILSDRLRGRMGAHKISAEERDDQIAKQRNFRKRKLEEIRQRFADSSTSMGSQKRKSVTKMTAIRCFEDVDYFPRDVPPNRLYVDPRSESLLVPINGKHIPFHSSTIKNVTCNPEDGQKQFTFRINFQVPGSQTVTAKGEENPLPEVTTPNSLFVKELLFRSEDGKHMQAIFRNVKEMIKRVKLRETEEDVARDLADQEKLQLNRTGRRILLKDLLVRPSVQGSQKENFIKDISKSLFINSFNFFVHYFGYILRFSFNSRHVDCVDITYSNIKHAFFQPCERELIVLIHFHLKSPIMVGKKKTDDVQFYTETGTQSDDLDNRRGGNFHDPDEMQDEMREREMKKRLNGEFKRFVTQVEEISRIEFEIPYRGLMFSGVPGKSNVEIMPTANCLVHLVEMPPFVLPLEDVELVSFERVQHGLKEFDMTFLFKDYTKPVKKIDLVPVTHLDNLKRWLNELEIVWYEGKNNLQWGNILKTIIEDKESFFEQGGFEGFLGDESEEEEDVDDEDEEEDDSYSGSEPESSSNEESDEEDSEEESLADESDDESYQEVESGEEEGLSWDELEEQAKNDDRKRIYATEEDTSHKRKKKKVQ